MMNNVIIYGAYGYTGRLIVERAVELGWTPTLAGRNLSLVKTLAEKYNLPFVSFEFDDKRSWDNALKDKDLLLNCAGPFSITIRDILPACIRNNTHYCDITGEIEVFEYIQGNDQKAKDAGIVMLPGVGFDVVPTDCLSLFLKEQLPTATHLELAFESNSGLSRGTAFSVLNRFHKGSAIRENRVIKEMAAASSNKLLPFNGKMKNAVGIAWGDVFTSFYTTGIPNIQVYTAMPEKTMNIMRKAGKWSWLIKTKLVQKMGRRIINKRIKGPGAEKRDSLMAHLYGKVWDDNGNVVEASLNTLESYKLTSITALICAEKILKGEASAGYNTPAGAFGSELIMEVEGSTRQLLD